MINNQQYIYVQEMNRYSLRFIAYFTPKFLIDFFFEFGISLDSLLKVVRKKRRVYLYQLHFHVLHFKIKWIYLDFKEKKT